MLELKEIEKSSKTFKIFFQKSNMSSSEYLENYANFQELEDAESS